MRIGSQSAAERLAGDHAQLGRHARRAALERLFRHVHVALVHGVPVVEAALIGTKHKQD